MQDEVFQQAVRKLQLIRGDLIFLESETRCLSDQQLRVIDLSAEIFSSQIAELAELRDASSQDEPETARQMAVLIRHLEEICAVIGEVQKSVVFLKADQICKGEQ